jgi:hypothetical protein
LFKYLVPLLLCLNLSLLSCKQTSELAKLPSFGNQELPFDSNINVPVRWGQTQLSGASLNVQVSSNFSNDEKDMIERTMLEWDSSAGHVDFFSFPSTPTANINTTSLSSYRDGVLGVYVSASWFNEVSSQALAVTQFFANRRNAGTGSEFLELTHADIIVNIRDFSFSLDQTPGTYDLETVILHEFGHFLGLGHQSNPSVDSVMQPYLSIFTSNQTLFNSDIISILDNYPASLYPIQAAPLLSAKSSASPYNLHPDEGMLVRGVIEIFPNGKHRVRIYNFNN